MNKKVVAIITMMFLFAMISFVTNLAAPIGVIWKHTIGSSNGNTVGMLGNAMNFLAYLFMGIPAGKMLSKVGYKRTALIGISVGLIGITLQYFSGKFDVGMTGFGVYLLGAFVSGFAVCMLNTVVNPMLNLLGGGGNRGNQLCLIGGTLNSLAGTLTPMLVGSLIGTVTAQTKMVDVNLVLFLAMAVFVFAFIALSFIPIEDPEICKTGSGVVYERSPWAFRHFVLGSIAIFFYVGVEVGIPGTLIFYMSDTTSRGGGEGLANATAIAGFVAGTYWLLMLIARVLIAGFANKISSRTMMTYATIGGIILIVSAIIMGKSVSIDMPVFTGSNFEMINVPIASFLLVCCGLFTSVLWSCIFNLATEGLGKYTSAASGIFMMMVVGGGLLPLLQNFLSDCMSYMMSYSVSLIAFIYMLYYARHGYKNVNKDILV